ncbi:MAG: class I SAM-dependent methyltransferase [Anaerolineae bacterium]
MDVVAYNRQAWNQQVAQGNPWTLPVSAEVVAQARLGRWTIVLTPTIPAPRSWFPDPLSGRDVLCLASGGGQQGPILAAAGAQVTVFDNSPAQLARDRQVAEREGLTIRTVQGDMADLSAFAGASFDLIFHPVSNCFAPAVRPVWRECYRVLRPGGALLAGFNNPLRYLFDAELADQGIFKVRHRLPYSDLTDLTEEERQRYQAQGLPLEFGHTLDDQIGGQLAAGFVLTGFFEDRSPDEVFTEYLATFIATRAVKPGG